MTAIIGIFGGTFDPIHNGHLAVAEFLSKSCPLTQIQFVPCLLPPHRRPPLATPAQRLDMIQLAISNHSNWMVNDIDFLRPGPSYMVDTLAILRQQQPQTRWCLILGMDAFLHFNEWRDWEKIMTLTHLIVVDRPGFQPPAAPWSEALLAKSQITAPSDLTQDLSGKILIQHMPPSSVSATEIRRQGHLAISKHSVPLDVLRYIQQHHLYSA
jgi:nicotinate-nucleotide adenylyltransferase